MPERPRNLQRRILTAALLLACAVALGGCDARQWFVCSLGFCGGSLDVFSPETPRELRADARTRQVVLSWAPNRDDATEYEIYRSTTPRGGFAKLLPLGAPRDQDTVTFVDRSVLNDVTYYYRVTAEDSFENESLPAETSATPRLGTLPDAPHDLTATATETSIDLTWARGSASASSITFRVFRAGPGETPALLSTASSERFSDRSFAPGATYRYSVVAVDEDGQQSAFSNEVAVVAHGVAGPRLPIAKWGTQGNGNGQFQEPVDVAVGPDGKVYVVDAVRHDVQRFSSAGVWERTFGIDGGPCTGGLTHPTGLAVDAGGTIYVTDSRIGQATSCVQMFHPDGQPAGAFGSAGIGDGHFQEATDVAVDAVGNAYVTDDVTDEIQKFDAAHQFVSRLEPDDGSDPPFDVPYGIAVDAAGALYVSSYSFGYIWVLAPGGQVTRRIGAGRGPGIGQLSRTAKLALDRSGHVYVADAGNDRIQAFSTAGALYTAFGGHGSEDGRFDSPQGVATDCQGNIYVADTGNHRMQKFGGSASVPCLNSPAARASAVRKPPGFRVRFTSAASRRGKLTGTTERGARERGTFTLTTTGRRGHGALARDFRRGTWSAVLSIKPGRSKVRVSGTMVLRGTFTTLGGTRGAARLRIGGRFDQTVSGAKSWVLKGTSGVGRHARARLPKRCRQLR